MYTNIAPGSMQNDVKIPYSKAFSIKLQVVLQDYQLAKATNTNCALSLTEFAQRLNTDLYVLIQ